MVEVGQNKDPKFLPFDEAASEDDTAVTAPGTHEDGGFTEDRTQFAGSLPQAVFVEERTQPVGPNDPRPLPADAILGFPESVTDAAPVPAQQDGRTAMAIPKMVRGDPVAEPRAEPRTSLIQAPEAILDAEASEEAQMRALLGGALRARHLLPPPPVVRRHKVRWLKVVRRIGLAAVLMTFTLAGYALTVTGVEARAKDDARAQAKELRELLQIGSLDHVRRFLPEFAATVRDAKELDRYREILARAEATLFRYEDADPRRRRNVRVLLEKRAAKPHRDRAIALALTLPARERGVVLSGIELPVELGDPCPDALRATDLGMHGAFRAARKSFARSEDAEPSHLPHLYAQLAMELESGRAQVADEVLDRMIDVHPDSPWTKLASARVRPGDARYPMLTLTKETDLPPVVRAWAHKLHGDRLMSENRAEDARKQYSLAMSLVHGDWTFAADFFEHDVRPKSVATLLTDEIKLRPAEAEEAPEPSPKKRSKRRSSKRKRRRR